MSYQVIARKWRPQTFEEVTGQEVITQTLRNAIEHGRLHHAYLFSGARGVGKTTTARLLAKSLNCHKTGEPNLDPCLLSDESICPSCREISESRSIDVIEFDAASNTQVEKIRDIVLDSIMVRPARDRFKIFVIDEVHQLSNHSFNALLKTIEEPPEDVVFILATTEFHKVPETIRSRCQEFQFRTISIQKIFDRLRLIADAENIDVTDEALREIARSGEGSMRDAQSNFDQVISFSGEKITSDDVTKALGFAGVDILRRVVTALADHDASAMLSVVDDLTERGHDLRNFCRDLLGVFRDLLVHKVSTGDKALIEGSVFSGEEMDGLFSGLTEADLLRFFNSVAETEASLKDASHGRYVLEVGLVKLVEMRRVESVEALLKKIDQLISNSPTADLALAEKKTQKLSSRDEFPHVETGHRADIPRPTESSRFVEEPPEEYFGEPPPVNSQAKPHASVISTIQSLPKMPVRLPTIPSEELEHVDDKVLDGAYEEKLALTGDDLVPLPRAHELAVAAIGETIGSGPLRAGLPLNGGAAVAAAPAHKVAGIPVFEENEYTSEILPTLGENPTDEDLLAYANSHPLVKHALKVFRGSIFAVDLTEK